MKLLVGLGNPGSRYRDTYHNVGFSVVDEIATRHGVGFGTSPTEAVTARVRAGGIDVLLVKPLTYMNLSGRAVGALARYYRVEPEDVLAIVDDVNLPLGRLRLRRGGSAGGHNGLRSIIEDLGTQAFPRLRVGVGRGDVRRDLSDYVLSRVAAEEREALDDAVRTAAEAAEWFAIEGIDAAMHRFNRGDAEETPEPNETTPT
ncbi:MAG: pth [Acidobacteria bacterium]|nr:pth [Acidobacteriota bacterium]